MTRRLSKALNNARNSVNNTMSHLRRNIGLSGTVVPDIAESSRLGEPKCLPNELGQTSIRAMSHGLRETKTRTENDAPEDYENVVFCHKPTEADGGRDGHVQEGNRDRHVRARDL